jgi:hypothetical protein
MAFYSGFFLILPRPQFSIFHWQKHENKTPFCEFPHFGVKMAKTAVAVPL